MKSTICPYDSKVICFYLAPENRTAIYECCDCAHFNPQKSKMVNPSEKRSSIGCLIAGITLIVGLLVLIGFLIHQIRP